MFSNWEDRKPSWIASLLERVWMPLMCVVTFMTCVCVKWGAKRVVLAKVSLVVFGVFTRYLSQGRGEQSWGGGIIWPGFPSYTGILWSELGIQPSFPPHFSCCPWLPSRTVNPAGSKAFVGLGPPSLNKLQNYRNMEEKNDLITPQIIGIGVTHTE